MLNSIICGDCKEILKNLEDNSCDLIITSPPYANQRKKIYGGIKNEDYLNWFLPISEQLLRVLKPQGTFILNIKENVQNGERSTYVLELILALKKQGWFWSEEFIWHKKTSMPGKWPNRFRDAWERLLQFNKTKKFTMYQDSVKIPIGLWAKERLKSLSDRDKTRNNSNTESGFGKNISNWIDQTTVYPTNVLHIATECNNKNHSAVFPETLPTWFIKLFTKETDVVLDPFIGSGTTAIAAKKLKRYFIGIDILSQYCEISRKRINEFN